jgi:hypothetical protein
MKLTILITSALTMALVAAGAAHAQPFNFLNGPGAREDTVAVSPPPFNVFLNHPVDSDLVYVSPEPVVVHHHYHMHHHYYY